VLLEGKGPSLALAVACCLLFPLRCSWHLGAEAMCEYSKKEFEEGLAELGCDSIDKLRAKLPTLRAEVQEAAKFRKIYQFAYLFSR
jgi:DCN1-like protein 1/2